MKIYCLFIDNHPNYVAPDATFIFNETPDFYSYIEERVGAYIKKNSQKIAECVANDFFIDNIDFNSPIHQIFKEFSNGPLRRSSHSEARTPVGFRAGPGCSKEPGDSEDSWHIQSIKYIIDSLSAIEAYYFLVYGEWSFNVVVIDITYTIFTD